MVSDGRGGPLTFVPSPGRMSGAKGALERLPQAERRPGDKGYGADWLRDEPKARTVRVRIPARGERKRPASPTRTLRTKRRRTGNAFSRLEDWRATALRCTRRGDLLLPAIALAAAVIVWLPLRAWSLAVLARGDAVGDAISASCRGTLARWGGFEPPTP